MLENKKIRVSAIQRLCLNDGPGVRTTIFLKGCYLNCPWCCNPEMINFDADYYFDKAKCKDKNQNFCVNCEMNCGNSPRENCPLRAFEKTFKDYSVDEIYDLILRDRNIFKQGGGVTFSGGEPLMQAENLVGLCKKIKQENIHIALETTLCAPTKKYEILSPFIDYWMVDLKIQFGDVPSEYFEQNLSLLSREKVQFRMVVMKEMKIYKIFQRLKRYNVDKIELLSYHKLAKNKYDQLGKTFTDFTPFTVEELHNLQEEFLKKGLETSVLSV